MTISGTTITMIRGDDESITINIDPHLEVGDSIILTIRQSPEDIIQFQKSVTAEDEATSLSLAINHSDTEQMEFGRYVYDVQLTRANGRIATLIPKSRFVLKEEVTY